MAWKLKKYVIFIMMSTDSIGRQGEELKVFGAGLLSSAAELEFVMKGIMV
jgi:phenylalanine-4-hydroxylase